MNRSVTKNGFWAGICLALCVVVLGNPSGAFGAGFEDPVRYDLPEGFAASTSSVGDTNSDGKLDVVVQLVGAAGFAVFLGDGSGGLSAPTEIHNVPINTSTGTAADFNRDGNLDVVSCDRTNGTAISTSDGAGDFLTFQLLRDSNSNLVNCVGVVAADFNEDGWNDLAIPNARDFTSIAINDQTGGFTVSKATSGLLVTGIAVGDFQGDGNLDLIEGLQVIRPSGGGTGYSILSGNGDGTFQDPTTVPSPTLGTDPGLGTGRFHGNAAPIDVIAASGLMTGLGDGTFSALTPNLASAALHKPPTIGDFDQDGTVDDIFGNSGDGARILTGNGDGTFTSGTPVASVGPPIGAGDLDGDGFADGIFTANSDLFVLLQDKTPPDSFVLVSPADESQNLRPLPNFSWTVEEDEDNPVDRYELWIDGAKNADLDSSECSVETCSTTPSSALSEGTHTWTVKAFDGAQNVRSSTSRQFTVDATSPTTFTLGSPSHGLQTREMRPQFSWLPATDSGVGLDHYDVYIDGSKSGSSIPAGQTTYLPSADLSEGQHSWRVEAVDHNSNARSSDTRIFTVDATGPGFVLSAAPPAITVSRSAQFAFSSPEPGSTFQCKLDSAEWSTCLSPKLVSGLTDGAHSFEVRAIDLLGNIGPLPLKHVWSVDTQTPPTARLTVAPTIALTNQTVTFDASSSTDHGDGLISTYEWDLDGNGSFESDTGAQPTASTTYDSSGSIEAAVRVTNNSGKSDTATVNLEVRSTPPPGDLGITINNGAQFTNDPNVTISSVWPVRAVTMRISNDGGFRNAETSLVSADKNWTLASSGPERLPKTVYVRFNGGESGRETYQDDIILDETPPVLNSVLASGGGASSSAALRSVSATSKRKVRKVRLKIRATDKTSGVGQMQVGVKKSSKLRKQKFRRSITFKTSSRFIWVRVIDKAGNFSKWRRVRA